MIQYYYTVILYYGACIQKIPNILQRFKIYNYTFNIVTYYYYYNVYNMLMFDQEM